MDPVLLHLLNRQLAHPAWDGLMILLTTVGLVAMPALIPALWRGRHHPVALALLLSQGVGLACALVLQELVARVRPVEARVLLGQPDCFSFPSGHATLVFGAAAVLLCSRLPRWLRWGAPVLALAVAVSRVAVGHHWPTDVIAGALLGTGLGMASHGLLASGARGLARWRWLLWPQLALVVVVSQAAWLGLLGSLDLPLSDKQLHFGMFGAVAFWLALWWEHPARPGGPLRAGRWLPLSLLLPLGLAALEELAQALSPVRTADPLDLGCDLAGMTLCWSLAWLALRWEGRRLVSAQGAL